MPAAKKLRMTAEHKAALAEGRALGHSVKAYLSALEQNRPKRGRKRTPDSVKKRLEAIDEALKDATDVRRIQLIQERRDLETELAAMGAKVDLTGLEKDFVKAAKGYSASKGITYGAWREFGVPAEVLRKAGITRGG